MTPTTLAILGVIAVLWIVAGVLLARDGGGPEEHDPQ